MRALTTFVSITVLLSLAAACAGTADEHSDGSEADITAGQAKCTKVDRSYTGVAKVTATTTGVKCYNDKGVVVGSMGAQASVTVAGEVKTGADKNPGRVKVNGTNTVDKKPLSCWLSTDYLCKGQGTTTASNGNPSIFCE